MIQKGADPFPFLRAESLAARAPRTVFDVDDAIWLTGRHAHGHWLAALKASRRKAAWLAMRTDHTVAGNHILADWLSRYTGALSVVPSLIDTANTKQRLHVDADRITLGWIGSESTAPYLSGLAADLDHLPRILGGRPVRLLQVGGTPISLRHVQVIRLPWSVEAESRALMEMDIGIMPLPDVPWTRGKCAYKALQYMSAGVPVVASDVGITSAVIGSGYCGYSVRNQAEWVDAIRTLAGDVTLRNRLGAQATRRVQEEYSVDRWGPVLAAILSGRSMSEISAAGAP